jgi:hypothetical protein
MTILEYVSGTDRRLDVSGYSSVLVEQEAYSPVWPTLALSLYKPGFLEVAISLRSNMRYLTTAEQDIMIVLCAGRLWSFARPENVNQNARYRQSNSAFVAKLSV